MTIFGFSPEEIKEFVGVVTVVGGSCVAGLSALWKWVIEPSFSVFKKIDHIYAEVKPNGGGSIKDSISRLEMATLTSQYRYRILAEEMRVCSFETDKDGQFTWVSKDWQVLTGLTTEEAQGNGWINSICQSDRQRVFLEWEDALDQKRDFVVEFSVNQIHPVRVKAQAMLYRNNKNEPVGMIGRLIRVETIVQSA